MLKYSSVTPKSLYLSRRQFLAAAPVALGVALTVSRQSVLGLIYPSFRYRTPTRPNSQYAFPDAASRAAALAIVMNDYPKLDSILHSTPSPDLTARDELGSSLLGLATTVIILVILAGIKPLEEHFRARMAERTIRVSADKGKITLEIIREASGMAWKSGYA